MQTEALPKAASASSPAPKAKAKELKSHKAKNAAANKTVATNKAQKVLDMAHMYFAVTAHVPY